MRGRGEITVDAEGVEASRCAREDVQGDLDVSVIVLD